MKKSIITIIALILAAVSLFSMTMCKPVVPADTTAEPGSLCTDTTCHDTTCPGSDTTADVSPSGDDTVTAPVEDSTSEPVSTDPASSDSSAQSDSSEPVSEPTSEPTSEPVTTDSAIPDTTAVTTIAQTTDPTCVHSYKDTVVAATCTEKGYTEHTCSKCGYSYRDSYTDATGHNYTKKVIAPTCTEGGYTLYTCTKCGNGYKGAYTEAKGHSYKATKTVAPTCTSGGYTVYTCSVCGATKSADNVNALGHDWSEWTVTKEATESANGEKTRTCKRCGEKETQSIDATGQVISYADYGDHTEQWFRLEDYKCYVVCDYRTWGDIPVMKRVGDTAVVTWYDKSNQLITVTMEMPAGRDPSTYMGMELKINDDNTYQVFVLTMGGAG